GRSGQGMLWLAHGLEVVEAQGQGQGPEVRSTFRANLAGWGRLLPRLREVFPHPDLAQPAAFRPAAPPALPAAFPAEAGSPSGGAGLWDAATGAPLGPFLPHPRPVYLVAFRPDGRQFATGCDDGSVRLWDAATLRPIGAPLRHNVAILDLAYSPDGAPLAVPDRAGVVRLWRSADGRPDGALTLPGDEAEGPAGTLLALAFSPDGATLAAGAADGLVRFWDRKSGCPLDRAIEHGGAVQSVAYR